jgi:hypothetical protein
MTYRGCIFWVNTSTLVFGLWPWDFANCLRSFEKQSISHLSDKELKASSKPKVKDLRPNFLIFFSTFLSFVALLFDVTQSPCVGLSVQLLPSRSCKAPAYRQWLCLSVCTTTSAQTEQVADLQADDARRRRRCYPTRLPLPTLGFSTAGFPG